MPYTKYYTGGTFGPGMSFPDRCYFENCTFLAQCTFGEACDFVSCKFQKCCPKPYSNPNSEVKKGSRLFKCTLEYVTLEQGVFLYEENDTGNRVINMGGPRKTTIEDRGGSGVSTSSSACGQRFNSKEFKTGKEFYPCGKTEAEGMINADVTLEQCGCK